MQLSYGTLDPKENSNFNPQVIDELITDKNGFSDIRPGPASFNYSEEDILPCREEIQILRREGKFKGPKVNIYAEAHDETFSNKTKKYLMQRADGVASILLLEGETTDPASLSSMRRTVSKNGVSYKHGAFYGIDEPGPKALGDLHFLYKRVQELEDKVARKNNSIFINLSVPTPDEWKKDTSNIVSVLIEQVIKNDFLYKELARLPVYRDFGSYEMGFAAQIKERTQSAVRDVNGHFESLIPSSLHDITALKQLLLKLTDATSADLEKNLNTGKTKGYKKFSKKDFFENGSIPEKIEAQANVKFFWRDYALSKNIGAIVCKNLNKDITINAVVGAMHANAIQTFLSSGLKKGSNDLNIRIINSYNFGKSLTGTTTDRPNNNLIPSGSAR